MTWIIGVAILCMLAVIIAAFLVVMPKMQSMQKLIDRLNLVSRENLDGLLVIRAFNTQRFEENRFNTANRNLADTSLFVNRSMASMMPLIMLIMNLTTVFIVWIGSHAVSSFSMNIGSMMAYNAVRNADHYVVYVPRDDVYHHSPRGRLRKTACKR